MRSYTALSRGDMKRLEGERMQRADGTLLSVSFKRQEGALGRKATCIVSKKVSAKAVTRNLVKRRCREALHETLIKSGLTGVLTVRAKRAAASASYAGIKKELAAHLSRFAPAH